MDAWLAGELAKGGKAFEDNLNPAEAAGSTDSNVSEIAHFLLPGQMASLGGCAFGGRRSMTRPGVHGLAGSRLAALEGVAGKSGPCGPLGHRMASAIDLYSYTVYYVG